MASFARYLSFQPLSLVLAAGVLYFGVMLVGLKRFLDAYFDDPRASVIGLLVIFGLWGSPWVSTGLHNLRAILYSGAYPSTLIFGIGFFMFSRALEFSKRQFKISDFFFFFLTTAFSFISHQLSAAIALSMMFLFQIFDGGIKKRALLFTILAVVSGLTASHYWLYFDPIALTIAGGRDPINKGNSNFESFLPVLFLIAPAFLGILGFGFCTLRNRYLALPVGFAVFFGCYLAGAVVGNPVTHRLLPPAILFLHLSFVLWFLSTVRADSLAKRRYLRFAYGLCFMTMMVELAVLTVDISKTAINYFAHNEPWKYGVMPVVSQMSQISRTLTRNSVVSASSTLSVSLPAFGGKLLASYRGINLVPDLMERRDMSSLLLGDTTQIAQRQAIVKRYGVTHLLFEDENVTSATMSELISMGQALPSPFGITLIQLGTGFKH